VAHVALFTRPPLDRTSRLWSCWVSSNAPVTTARHCSTSCGSARRSCARSPPWLWVAWLNLPAEFEHVGEVENLSLMNPNLFLSPPLLFSSSTLFSQVCSYCIFSELGGGQFQVPFVHILHHCQHTKAVHHSTWPAIVSCQTQ
jgi:hypothetical protein